MLTHFKHYGQLSKARPNLSVISPLSFWISVGYIFINALLGYVIYSQPRNGGLVVYQLLSPHIWSFVFYFLSIGLVYGLAANDWAVTRLMLVLGLLVKSVFAYALVALGLKVGFTAILPVMSIWLFIVWVQFCTVVFFLPPSLTKRSFPNGDRIY